jgi:hypothetical protein
VCGAQLVGDVGHRIAVYGQLLPQDFFRKKVAHGEMLKMCFQFQVFYKRAFAGPYRSGDAYDDHLFYLIFKF